jgi:EAL and modified HD-GYP domain-containing signal transduction protein
MLKWLGKVFGGTAAHAPSGDGEVPLPPPKVPLREDTDNEVAGSAAGFLSRHVIINRDCHPVGYLMAMRDRSRARMASLDQATAKINDQLMIRAVNGLGVDKIARFRQIWLEVVDGFLAHPLIETLPARSTVIVVRLHGAAPPDDELLARARALRASGFRLALSRWADTPACAAWLPEIDYVVVDVSGLNPLDITTQAQQLHEKLPGVALVAMHVDSLEEFECCRGAPFALFQGGFLTRRENWPPQPQMNPQRARLAQLMQKLQRGGELGEIAAELRHSPELSYRLLRYINSAGMGLSTRIASIEQALLILGREKLYRWLTLLLFSAGQGGAVDATLLEQALVRARFMELLAPDSASSVQRDELFIVGVFSLLDVLLKLPLSVALEPLALPETINDALLRDRGPLASRLRLVVAAEAHDDAAMADAALALALKVDTVNARHMEALNWAQETLTPETAGA